MPSIHPLPLAGATEDVRATTLLQAGQLSRPIKCWATSTRVTIGFWQAPPYTESFTVFYKKSGALFGTEITIPAQAALGPELSIRPPVEGEVQYFEYEIRKLKPSTSYNVKLRTSDGSSSVRLDRVSTISGDDEKNRDNYMANFKGALVRLGDYDGLVQAYAPVTGIFTVRMLQFEEASLALQLTRFTSDYTDNGLPVQAYTLSQVRFCRWGGEIRDSVVVAEGELRWLVARALQVEERSEAQAAGEARQRLLALQVEKVTAGMAAEWGARLADTQRKTLTGVVVVVLLALAAAGAAGFALSRSRSQHKVLSARYTACEAHSAALNQELSMLALYRASLELDMGTRMAAAAGTVRNASHASTLPGTDFGTVLAGSSSGTATIGDSSPTRDAQDGISPQDSSNPVDAKAGGGSAETVIDGRPAGGGEEGAASLSSWGPGRSKRRRHERHKHEHVACQHCGRGAAGAGKCRKGSKDDARAAGPAAGSGPSQQGSAGSGGGVSAAAAHVLSEEGLRALLRYSQLTGSTPRSAAGPIDGSGRGGMGGYGHSAGAGAGTGASMSGTSAAGMHADASSTSPLLDGAPQPWVFVQHASQQYALYLQEWLKAQMSQAIRLKVHALLRDNAAGSGNSSSSFQVEDLLNSRSMPIDDTAAQPAPNRHGHDPRLSAGQQGLSHDTHATSHGLDASSKVSAAVTAAAEGQEAGRGLHTRRRLKAEQGLSEEDACALPPGRLHRQGESAGRAPVP